MSKKGEAAEFSPLIRVTAWPSSLPQGAEKRAEGFGVGRFFPHLAPVDEHDAVGEGLRHLRLVGYVYLKNGLRVPCGTNDWVNADRKPLIDILLSRVGEQDHPTLPLATNRAAEANRRAWKKGGHRPPSTSSLIPM
ncbi:MAG TPA: hypothetical protein VIL22_07555 [Paenibacillaceae bacterium]